MTFGGNSTSDCRTAYPSPSGRLPEHQTISGQESVFGLGIPCDPYIYIYMYSFKVTRLFWIFCSAKAANSTQSTYQQGDGADVRLNAGYSTIS